MSSKIKIQVLGEEYQLYFEPEINTGKCTVRLFGKEEKLSATIVNGYIVLDKPINLVGKDWKTLKKIEKIKVPKDFYHILVDYYGYPQKEIIKDDIMEKINLNKTLEKAKKLYPIGTEFVSLFGAKDIITPPTTFSGKIDDTYIIDNNSIFVNGKYNRRMIYDGLRWAEIIKGEKKIKKAKSLVVDNVIDIKLSKIKDEDILNYPKLNIQGSNVKYLFSKLSDEERLEIISGYCKYCGCGDPGCQCWNDD